MIKVFYSEKTHSSQTVTIIREIDVFEDLNIITSLIVSVSPSPRPMNLVCLIHGYILADGCSDTGLALALVKGACVLVVEIFEITSLFFIQFGIFRKFILLQL